MNNSNCIKNCVYYCVFLPPGPHKGKELPRYVFFYRDQTKIVFETRLNFSGEFSIVFFCRHELTDSLDQDELDIITFCEFANYKLVCNYEEPPKKIRKKGHTGESVQKVWESVQKIRQLVFHARQKVGTYK